MFNNFAIFVLALSAAVYGTEEDPLAVVVPLSFQETADLRDSSFDRLIAGSLAEPNEFPFIAAILLKQNRTIPDVCALSSDKCRHLLISYYFHCSGVIISPQFVLTTAQCIINRKDDLHKIRIRTGTNSLWDNEGETHEVESYHLHNKTKRESGKTVVDYTIGVYKLKHPLKINNKQKPIRFAALPEAIITRDPGSLDMFFSGSWYGTVVGWGREFPTGYVRPYPLPIYYAPKLLKMQETVVIERIPRCKRFIFEYRNKPLKDHEICGYVGEDIGSDGATLIYENNLIGISTYSGYRFINEIFPVGTEGRGAYFAYIEYLKDFITATVTDY
ncbi:trypsin-like [Prorops nasuta]|uniref:trypsin-like n=1 Tax=Prorops nasuta TaxID=863751 RepID=UPI0034CE7F26